jgi:L-amino acid N-acyltransferase YncA
MHSYFRQYDQATEGILHLLEGTQLGTNGAKYTHLDTRKHVQEIDEPFYLTLEKRDTVIANLTFCKRDKDWYLRYFAFHQAFQRKKAKAGSTSNNLFKTELNTFFNQQLESEKVHRFYAYIDPKNDRSMAMAQNFGFEKVSEIITHTFS